MIYNILKGEFYKFKSNSYYRNVFISITTLTLIYCMYIVLCRKIESSEMFIGYFFSNILTLVCTFALFNYVYAEEYRNKTLKNIFTLSFDKKKIYLGKLFFQLAISLVLFLIVICCGVLIMLGMRFSSKSSIDIKNMLVYFGVSISLIFRALGYLNIITVITQNELFSFLLYILYIYFGKYIIIFLGSMFGNTDMLSKIIIQNQVAEMFGCNYGSIIFIMVINITLFLIYNLLSMYIYSKRDLKL